MLLATFTAAFYKASLAQSLPKFVTYTLAGVDMRSLKNTQDFEVMYDAKREYFLIPEISEGKYRSLLLIRPKDMYDDPAEGFKPNRIVTKRLRSLSNEKGVSIGDTERSVVRKLGKPSRREDRDNGGVLLYYLYEGGRIYGWSYSCWYELKRGRVSAIRLDLQKGSVMAG